MRNTWFEWTKCVLVTHEKYQCIQNKINWLNVDHSKTFIIKRLKIKSSKTNDPHRSVYSRASSQQLTGH